MRSYRTSEKIDLNNEQSSILDNYPDVKKLIQNKHSPEDFTIFVDTTEFFLECDKSTDNTKNTDIITVTKQILTKPIVSFSFSFNINPVVNHERHCAQELDHKQDQIPVSNDDINNTKSILVDRFKGKPGHIKNHVLNRQHLRTIINGDPERCMIMPLICAKNQTYPETVTADNYEKLSLLVKNGPNVYPGVNSIMRISKETGKYINVKLQENIILEHGDMIERHLQPGDTVMCYESFIFSFFDLPDERDYSGGRTYFSFKVRVIDKTIRMSVPLHVTSPFEADFDGDDMNIHVPASVMDAINKYDTTKFDNDMD